MQVERQTSFDGGLNTRLSPERIGQNQLTEAKNVNYTKANLNGDYQPKQGGGKNYYYEEADYWYDVDAFNTTPARPGDLFSFKDPEYPTYNRPNAFYIVLKNVDQATTFASGAGKCTFDLNFMSMQLFSGCRHGLSNRSASGHTNGYASTLNFQIDTVANSPNTAGNPSATWPGITLPTEWVGDATYNTTLGPSAPTVNKTFVPFPLTNTNGVDWGYGIQVIDDSIVRLWWNTADLNLYIARLGSSLGTLDPDVYTNWSKNKPFVIFTSSFTGPIMASIQIIASDVVRGTQTLTADGSTTPGMGSIVGSYFLDHWEPFQIAKGWHAFIGSHPAVVQYLTSQGDQDSVYALNVSQETRGTFNAVDFVEYNKDLYLVKGEFNIGIRTTAGSKSITTKFTDHPQNIIGWRDTWKLQLGDRLKNNYTVTQSDTFNSGFYPQEQAIYRNNGKLIVDGSKITSIDYVNDTIEIDQAAILDSDQSGKSYTSIDLGPNHRSRTVAPTTLVPKLVTVQPSLSRYLDGKIDKTYPVTVPPPHTANITYSQLTTTNTGTPDERKGGHTQGWYSTTYVVPFQYALSHIDETGNESTYTSLTDSAISRSNFKVGEGENNIPQYISITGGYRGHPTLLKDTLQTKNTQASVENARHRLYRVGGSSAIWKKVADLYLDPELTLDINVATTFVYRLNFSLYFWNEDCQYRLRWFAHPTDTGWKDYRYTALDGTYSEGVEGETEWLVGPVSWQNNAKYWGPLTFYLDRGGGVTTGGASLVNVDLILDVRIPGESIPREYVAGAYTIRAGSGANDYVAVAPSTGVFDDQTNHNANRYHFIDWISPDALIDVEPIKENNSLVVSPDFLKEANNIFFAAKNKRIYFSDYANPTSFPEHQYLDVDYQITGMEVLGSECVVFTSAGVYRCFGTNPEFMSLVKVATTDGVPPGGGKCITKLDKGLMYVSFNGICYFNGQDVERLTHDLVENITVPHSSGSIGSCVAGAHDNNFYYLGDEDGWKIDFKNGIKISKTDLRATHLNYIKKNNELATNDKTITHVNDSTTEKKQWTIKTRAFYGNDSSVEKYFYAVGIDAHNFKGTVEMYVDGLLVKSALINNVVADYERTVFFTKPKQGNEMQVRLVNCEGELKGITVYHDLANSFTEMLFNYCTIKYIGSPTIELSLDGTVLKTVTMELRSDSGVNEGNIFFPPMSTGMVPFVREVNNEENGRMVDVQWSTTEIQDRQ